MESNKKTFLEGLATGGILVAALVLVLVFGLGAANKALGSFSSPTAPPTNLSYLLVSQAVDSPQFRFATSVSNNVVTSEIAMGAVRSTLATATSTPCTLQNPYNATSTYSFALQITTGTSTAAYFTVGTSTTPDATSTSPVITSTAIGANQPGTITFDPGTNNGIVGPNGYITAGVTNGSVSYGYTYGGFCEAVINSIT